MSKYFMPGMWQFEHATGNIIHIKAGEYEELQCTTKENVDVVIPRMYHNELIHFMDENNMIKPKMDNASREMDLKIVHRLLDLQEKLIEKGGNQP
jgi:hypothetical protein